MKIRISMRRLYVCVGVSVCVDCMRGCVCMRRLYACARVSACVGSMHAYARVSACVGSICEYGEYKFLMVCLRVPM